MKIAAILAESLYIPSRNCVGCIAFIALVMAAASSDAQVTIAYTAEITGVEDEELEEILRGLSQALQKQAAPPASIAQLRRRADDDVERFLQAFHALGYYGATVDYEIDEQAEPVQLRFRADPGVQYTLNEIRVVGVEDAAEIDLPEPADIGLQPEMPALSETIVDAQTRLETRLQNTGYPFAEVIDREAVVDHADQTMNLTFSVASGPEATFGRLQIEGLEKVLPRYVERIVPWEVGETYNRSELNEARERLYESGLFSSAQLAPSEELDENGRVPITIDVTERKHRTISAGVDFSTDEGPGATGQWEHRNLDGLGRQLQLEVRASTLLSRIHGEYRLPWFRRTGQSLVYTAELADEDTDAFDSQRFVTTVRVDRELNERQDVSYGVGLRLSSVEQQERDEDFALIFFPLSWARDTSDDALDPTRGSRIKLLLTPFLNVSDVGEPFLKAEALWSQYIALSQDPSWVLALRGRAGFITSAQRSDVPPDVLFFSGGGGSIRGFPFQSAGPLVDEDEPLGGRSVLEASFEIRRRFTEQIGGVVFVDVGTVFAPSVPEFDPTPRVGAGVGLRYYSPLGPLRFDIAFPINRRDDVDPILQFYFSIGQAF